MAHSFESLREQLGYPPQRGDIILQEYGGETFSGYSAVLI